MSGRAQRLIKKELRQCKATTIHDCRVTKKTIDNLVGNPAGTNNKDYINPGYKGRITREGANIIIALSIAFTGNINRAKSAAKNIEKVYATQQIIVKFKEASKNYDLRIHGATLSEFVQGLGLCECGSAMKVGGWGPSYKHIKYGDTLLVNHHANRRDWELVDAHEFSHKLGLQHRKGLGVMAYWDSKKNRVDPRKFLRSERDRIAFLYL
jgi:hypothetical protein